LTSSLEEEEFKDILKDIQRVKEIVDFSKVEEIKREERV